MNKANTERILSTYTNESVIDASGVAQSIIEEIQKKAFDESTITKAVWKIDSLTSIINLGSEAGEYQHTDFDDIDDYNNYNTTVTLDRMGDFDISVIVNYVSTLNPKLISSTPTFSKRIEVSLTNYSLLDTLKYHHVVSY
ncbi:MAG: hypothetical protein HKP17_05950 [Ignavibacteriaceae bacterium]|nr:hypothetical protein [Ignavibacteriaceae bacterium]